jgi:hypothetical protein
MLKLTPPRQELILEQLEAGRPVTTACAAAGISEQTFYRWIQWGELELTKKKYRDFAVKARKAIAKWEGGMLDQLDEMARHAGTKEIQCPDCKHKFLVALDYQTKFKAATWLLEKRRPSQYGNHTTLEVKGDAALQQLITAMADHLRADEYVRFLEVASAVLGIQGLDARAIGPGESEGDEVIETEASDMDGELDGLHPEGKPEDGGPNSPQRRH